MRSVSLSQQGYCWALPVFVVVVVCCLLPIPVSAEDGYSGGAPLGAPNWILERMDTSIMPDYYLPPNTTSDQVRVPTYSSYISSGNKLLTSGSYADAKSAFENAIQKKPESFDAWVGRGLALEGLNRSLTSIESYEKAISYAPDDGSSWVAHAGKGRVLLELNKYQEAADSLETAINEYTRSGSSNMDDLVSIYNHLAEAKSRLGLKDEADAAKKKATSLKSGNGPIFGNKSSL
jgi:tetratricopeptide (TPR) repeat protein